MLNQKKVGKSGGISIPVSMRRDMGLQPGDAMDVVMKDGAVVLTPTVPRCQICENTNDVVKLFGKYICKDCAELALGVFNEKEGGANE